MFQVDRNKYNPEHIKLDVDLANERRDRKAVKENAENTSDIYAEYIQSNVSKVVRKIIYPVLWAAALFLMIFSYTFPSDILLSLASSIAVGVTWISFLLLGWYMIYQLRIGTAFNYYMYRAAVIKFRICSIVCAAIITVNPILSFIQLNLSPGSMSMAEIWIIVCQIIAAVIMWVLVIIERLRKVVITGERFY